MDADQFDYPDQRDITLYYVNHAWDMTSKSTVETPEKENVHIHTNTRCVAIREDGVEVENQDGDRQFISADTVIQATGLKPDKAALAQFEGLAHDVILLATARSPATSTTPLPPAITLPCSSDTGISPQSMRPLRPLSRRCNSHFSHGHRSASHWGCAPFYSIMKHRLPACGRRCFPVCSAA